MSCLGGAGSWFKLFNIMFSLTLNPVWFLKPYVLKSTIGLWAVLIWSWLRLVGLPIQLFWKLDTSTVYSFCITFYSCRFVCWICACWPTLGPEDQGMYDPLFKNIFPVSIEGFYMSRHWNLKWKVKWTKVRKVGFLRKQLTPRN